MGKNKSKNKAFKIEYDAAKEKYYLSKNGILLESFYGFFALSEYLLRECNLTESQIVELTENIY